MTAIAAATATTAADPGHNVERRFRINGSEAATIVGENPYEKPEDLMFKKCFDMPFEGNECTEHGKRYEPVALRILADRIGCKLEPIRYETSKKYPWLGGTIDALLSFPDGRLELAEVKCPMRRRIVPGQVPMHYYIQPQLYLMIWNEIDGRIGRCSFVQYKPGYETTVRKIKRSETLDITPVDKDDRYMLERLPALKTFWDKLYLWKESVGKYQAKVSSNLIKAFLKRSIEVKEKARMHWICRLKAAAAKQFVEIPFQKPIDLRIQFVTYCLAQGSALEIESFKFGGIKRELVRFG